VSLGLLVVVTSTMGEQAELPVHSSTWLNPPRERAW
jgi:hypothetical protein